MSTYVVGDIHGYFDEWILLKNKIEEEDSDAKFILVGDIVDRGPKSLCMLEWCIENITKDGKYQMVLGNHELEKIIWMNKYFELKKKYSGIYEVELNSVKPDRYDFVKNLICNSIDDKTIRKYLIWMSSLDYFKDIELNGVRYIIAHANIPYSILASDNKTLKTKDKISFSELDYITFNRDTEGYFITDNTIFVHGHTPTCLGDQVYYGAIPGRIRFTYNRVNVDCGLAYRKYLDGMGDLGAIRLEDLAEFYLYGDTLEFSENGIDENSEKAKEEMINTFINRG